MAEPVFDPIDIPAWRERLLRGWQGLIAGEVGSALGIIFPIPGQWTKPFNDQLETYVPGMEKSGSANW